MRVSGSPVLSSLNLNRVNFNPRDTRSRTDDPPPLLESELLGFLCKVKLDRHLTLTDT